VLPSVVRLCGPNFGPPHAFGHRQHMDPMIADDNVEVLARGMIAQFPADAADQAVLRASAFFAMGYIEKSKKWLLVRAKIKNILADTGTDSRSLSIAISA
jgi:hypothetical protein